jgi:hypothetical protein
MMFRTRFALFALQFAVAFGLVPGVATAGIIDTVNWAPDTTENGTGTGTLAGGTITVTYTTSVGGPINAGETFSNRDWSTGLGTAAAAPDGTTYDTGGALGEYAGVTQSQVITLSQNVTNPILFFNFDDPQSSYNFGTLPLTLLASHNAQLASDIVTFNGSSNTVNDGFAVQVGGTFGPGQDITFSASSTINATQSVTVGLASVPEPSSLLMAATAIGVGFVLGRSRQRRAQGRQRPRRMTDPTV